MLMQDKVWHFTIPTLLEKGELAQLDGHSSDEHPFPYVKGTCESGWERKNNGAKLFMGTGGPRSTLHA